MIELIPRDLLIPRRATITCRITNYGLTREGKRLFGKRIKPRKAKGYRRHVRTMKARAR